MKTFTNPRDRLPSDDFCLYKDQKHNIPHYPSLTKDITVEICIIGGGFTGLVTAINLAKAGVAVALIERHKIGWGASGRNSGQLIPGFNTDVRKLANLYGEDIARDAFGATVHTLQAIKDTIIQESIECDLKDGLIATAPSSSAVKDLEDYQRYVADVCDYTTYCLNGYETAQALGTSAYKGALRDDNAGRFNPYRYILGLTSYAQRLGVQIFEETPAVKVDNADTVHVQTPQGVIRANKVLLAGGAYQGSLIPALRRKYLLLRTSMIATGVLDLDIYERVMPADTAVFEWRHLLSYYQKTADGRVIFGGGDSPLFSNKKEEVRAFSKIATRMGTIFPDLAGCHISHWWGGYMDVTRHQIPEIGQIDGKIYYAFGYSGHGVVPSHMVAGVLANMMRAQGDVPQFIDHFQATPIPFAGRHDAAIARLGILWHRILDMV